MGLTSDATTAEPIDLEEAKRQLRILDDSFDQEISDLIRSARDWAERYTNRTLRAAVQRTLTQSAWPHHGWRFPWPPFVAFGDPAIAYYDAAGDLQELEDDGSYYVDQNTDGSSRLLWSPDFELPELADRHDAVNVKFITGGPVPPLAVAAIKLKLTELFGGLSTDELQAARRAAMNLLRELDLTPYA